MVFNDNTIMSLDAEAKGGFIGCFVEVALRRDTPVSGNLVMINLLARKICDSHQ